MCELATLLTKRDSDVIERRYDGVELFTQQEFYGYYKTHDVWNVAEPEFKTTPVIAGVATASSTSQGCKHDKRKADVSLDEENHPKIGSNDIRVSLANKRHSGGVIAWAKPRKPLKDSSNTALMASESTTLNADISAKTKTQSQHVHKEYHRVRTNTMNIQANALKSDIINPKPKQACKYDLSSLSVEEDEYGGLLD